MRRTHLTCAVLVLAVLAIGSTAQAGSSGTVYRTQLTLKKAWRIDAPGPHSYSVRVWMLGKVNSSKHGCIRGRTVSLYFKKDGKRHLRDEGRSSRHGAIGLTGYANYAPDRIILEVRRKQINRHHPHYGCGPAKFVPDIRLAP